MNETVLQTIIKPGIKAYKGMTSEEEDKKIDETINRRFDNE
jgi:hypothetical protein